MAYETKVILTLLANNIARCESAREAYNCVVRAASVEGLKLPTYDEFIAELKKEKEELK